MSVEQTRIKSLNRFPGDLFIPEINKFTLTIIETYLSGNRKYGLT